MSISSPVSLSTLLSVADLECHSRRDPRAPKATRGWGAWRGILLPAGGASQKVFDFWLLTDDRRLTSPTVNGGREQIRRRRKTTVQCLRASQFECSVRLSVRLSETQGGLRLQCRLLPLCCVPTTADRRSVGGCLSVAEMRSTCQHIAHSIIADRQTDAVTVWEIINFALLITFIVLLIKRTENSFRSLKVQKV